MLQKVKWQNEWDPNDALCECEEQLNHWSKAKGALYNYQRLDATAL